MDPATHDSRDVPGRSATLRAFDDIAVAIALLLSAGVGIWLQLTYYTVKRGKFAYAGRLTPKTRLVLRARDVAGNLSRPVKISSL